LLLRKKFILFVKITIFLSWQNQAKKNEVLTNNSSKILIPQHLDQASCDSFKKYQEVITQNIYLFFMQRYIL